MVGWFDLRGASHYCSLSVSTLRRFIGHAEHPLPARLVGGKLLIRPTDIDTWILSFDDGHDSINKLVDEVLKDIKGKRHNPQR